MFFKRIEMTGFKSFATKTVVDLKPGVTIVVGPNGCGKSNIFDAIRWVLGEQSAKSLRGQKMGDVIFQGSATYKPMGCSQVTLVINNEGRRLPIDFSEVSITRRLYRSGESEYQINKSPCRLRDIHELFLDTGVGTDSYSIMEQGKVADIIKSRPEDRRALLEEAAGIAKYKVRKVEALRKLERTEQDLVRLADRIAESRTRCNSLKRQASKAERYKKLKDQVDGLDKKLVALDLTGINERAEATEKSYREAKDRLAVAQAASDRIEALRSELMLTMQEADGELSDLSQQRVDQQEFINNITREVMDLSGRARNEEQRARDIDQQLDGVRLRRDEASRHLADANAEEARLAVRQIELTAQQNIRRAEYERLRADSEATRRNIREMREMVERKGEEAMRLKQERGRLQMQLEMARKAQEDFNRQKQEHETEITRLGEEIENARADLDTRTTDLKKLKEEHEAARNEAQEALRARSVLQKEHREAERDLAKARSALEAQERLARDYEGYYAGVKSVMRGVEDGHLRGIIGVVPELMQSMEAEHDLAMEIALGNHVQDIVVRTAEDAKAAIRYLKEEGRGRATLLPLDIIDGREGGGGVERVLGNPGVVGLASNLVSYDSEIQPVVNHLLGRTVVTDNTDVTLRLVRGGQRNRYVTLDGQLTSPGGAMTGGSRGQSQIMTRQREITELTQTVKNVSARESDLSRRIEKRETEMVGLNAKGEELRGKIEELRIDLNREEANLGALRQAREQREKAFAELRENAERSGSTTEKDAAALAECSVRLADLEETIESNRERITTMEDAIYGSNQEVDELGQSVNEIDQEITRLKERREHLRERAETYVSEREGQERSAQQLRLEQQRLREESHRLKQQAVRSESEKAELQKDVEGIAAKAEKAARAKEEAQKALRAESENAQSSNRELNDAMNAHDDAHTKHTNLEADMRRLRERASDRFDQDLKALAEEVGEVEEDRESIAIELEHAKDQLRRMDGNINMGALVEYEEEQNRYEFLTTQENDLLSARDSLRETINTIDKTTSKLFWEAFEAIRQNFIHVYRRLFGGGKADLVLLPVEDDADPLLDAGIEIVAQPPGKKLQNISLLSGGEQALTAVSLMFGIFMHKPSPFCVLDEIDAPLDDSNVARLRNMLQEFARNTQFIIISHNKITMELADTLYGITMQETGVSSLVSVAFDQVDALNAGAGA